MNEIPLFPTIEGWDWDSARNFVEKDQLAKIEVGSSIELQLSFIVGAVFRHWSKESSLEEQESLGIIDYESITGRLQPLRPGSNITYFEGSVSEIERKVSRTDNTVELVQALLDCGVPIVLSAFVRRNNPHPLVKHEGANIIGIGTLFGEVSSSDSLFKSPIKARIISIRRPKAFPSRVTIGIERAENGLPAVNTISYIYETD